MKVKKRSRRNYVTSTALLGKGWKVEANFPWGWNVGGGGDGHGGRAPSKPDTVYMIAWPNEPQNGTLLARTTILDMVKECVRLSIEPPSKKIAPGRESRNMDRLRLALLHAAKYIFDKTTKT